MPKMTALYQFQYAGRLLAVGEEFEASERDAKVLELVKRADRVAAEPEAKQPAANPAPNNRAMKAEASATSKAKKPAAKRTYKRRDIKTGD